MYHIKDDKDVRFSVSTTINANPKEVWEVLVDNKNWYKWTNLISKFEGDFSPNAEIKVTFNTPNGATTFDRTLFLFEENRVFAWEGEAIVPGSKDHHVFFLEEDENGNTIFTQGDGFYNVERTEEIIAFEGQLKQAYEIMNVDLKKYVESKYTKID